MKRFKGEKKTEQRGRNTGTKLAKPHFCVSERLAVCPSGSSAQTNSTKPTNGDIATPKHPLVRRLA